ncbi:hypothetical protein [Streptomyces lydicus]|uniref:hypothetical protein n=1 Tax=Streptomyces lydicus TaxID=47763 RepID=UPI0037AE9911
MTAHAQPTPEVTARQFFAALDPNTPPYIPELHHDDCEDPDCTRCIELTPTSPQTNATEGALAEQRHQLFDLDADSAYTVPGCICACPPKPAA